MLGGITPFSTLDFPNCLSAVFFVQGCPLRCRYCHNPDLQASKNPDSIPLDVALEWLETRKELLDAVVLSGGEPTTWPNLGVALWEIRQLGFKTALHTAGIYPARLKEVLPLLNWVGLDIKGPIKSYPELTGIPGGDTLIRHSLQALQDSTVDFEIRTTVHLHLLSMTNLVDMAKELQDLGIDRWILQEFRSTGCRDSELIGHSPTLTLELIGSLKKWVPEINLRKAG